MRTLRPRRVTPQSHRAGQTGLGLQREGPDPPQPSAQAREGGRCPRPEVLEPPRHLPLGLRHPAVTRGDCAPLAPPSCCEQTQLRCPPTPARFPPRKDTGGGEDRDTHRFLLVFTFGSSLPSSELDTSLWSAERERGQQGWGLAAIALAGPGARTPSRLTGSWAVGSGLARLPPARPSALPQRRKLAASSAGTSPLATAHCAAAGTGGGGRGREFKAGAAPSLPAADAGQDAASGPRLPCVLAGDHQTWVPLCPLQGAVGLPLHVARTSPLATRRLQKAGLISKTGPPLAPRDGLCERSRSFRNER